LRLTSGTRLGVYEITEQIGEGGMGQVYRGRDPRLQREVAIKVLARAGTDPVRQRRFVKEAQAASALNHPGIVTVYDVGWHEGVPYLVTELVDGTSVRDLVARAPLRVRQVLDVGAQLAEGLAAAHQGGIVHRDVKPENVMVTRDGRVKILDFGLAIVGRGESEASDTTDTVTSPGMIVGTVPYMSPEQVRGARVDYRTDQFALGLTLYELLAGRRAFVAETAAQVQAAILDKEPEPLAVVNPRVPAPVRWVIERCLAKDARDRYDATADLARDLRALRDRLPEYSAPAAPESPRRPPWIKWAAATAVVAVGGLAAFSWRGSGISGPDLSSYRMIPIATDSRYQGAPSWSPDGKTLAYVSDVDDVLQVFTRALSSSMRAQITRGRFDCRDPFWSPDGTRLYFISLARDRDGLWNISAAGGQPELVMENVSRAAISPDGKTLAMFRPGSSEEFTGLIWLSSPPDAAPVRYSRQPFGAQRGFLDAALHFSPDSSKLGVWVEPQLRAEQPLRTQFWVLPMDDAAPYLAPLPASDLPNFAAPFSWLPDSRQVLSALPFPRPGVHLWVSAIDRSAPRLLTMTGGIENEPSVSPDGSRLALTLQQSDYDVFQLAVGGSPLSVVLETSRNESDPAWSPVGDQMAFTTDRTGHQEIWLRSRKGDWERPLVSRTDFGASSTYDLSTPAFAPDGQRIAFGRLSDDAASIWIAPVAGGPPVQLTSDKSWQEWPSWSPDGAWIAFGGGRESQPMSGMSWTLRRARVGAKAPAEVLARDIVLESPVRWSPEGSWIAYNSATGLAIISPDGQSRRSVHEQTWFAFDWSLDGRRIYGIRASDDFRHLTFTSVDVASGAERVIADSFRPLPAWGPSVRGFTRVSATAFLTSIADMRSDIWIMEGLDNPANARNPLATLWPFSR
jgi:serine/threonine protein kinase